MGFGARARRFAVGFLAAIGVFTLAGTAWIVLGGPLLIDSYLVINDAPRPARAIVCLAGGFSGNSLPTAAGLQRIYTAVQLHADGFAPVVVFSGGGPQKLSEAEVYSEAAGWLGLPPSAVVLDPFPGSTADHPGNLLKIASLGLTRDTPLLVVTSALHARRVQLCFRRTGFTDVRIVTAWEAGKAGAEVARGQRASAVQGFTPNNKRYDDPLNRLNWGLTRLLDSAHEWAAIALYKLRGQI